MWNRPRLLAGTSALLLAASLGNAAAGARDFAVYTTRLGGDTDSAQPYIDRFAAYVEANTGWPKGSLKGRFLSTKKEATAFFDTQKPGFAVIEPWLYFELRAAQHLEAVTEVSGVDINSARLHVLVKDAAIKSLDDLKGKRLWTHLADSPRYLSNVVLDGKVTAETHFALKQVGNSMKALRAVLRGEADAALVDDEQLQAAKTLEGGAALHSIYDSGPLPPVLLVACAGTLSAADKATLQKTVLPLCGTPKGQDICKEMHISKFNPVDTTRLSAAEKRYDKAAGAGK